MNNLKIINNNINLINNCKLCSVTKDSLNNKNNSLIENRLLFSTNSFIITPCIGPLTSGHVLITSKEHYNNLSQMKTEVIKEILITKSIIENKLSHFYKNYIIAEHGSIKFKQGACIIHTHLHIIPNAINIIPLFDDLLKEKIMIENLIDIKKINYPYILISTNQKNYVYKVQSIQSQLIRKFFYIANKKIGNWDWKEDRNENDIKKTIKIWSKLEK